MKTRILFLFLALQTLAALAADITGNWKSEFDSQIRQQQYTFTFKQDGATLTGKANSQVEDRQREVLRSGGMRELGKRYAMQMLKLQGIEFKEVERPGLLPTAMTQPAAN